MTRGARASPKSDREDAARGLHLPKRDLQAVPPGMQVFPVFSRVVVTDSERELYISADMIAISRAAPAPSKEPSARFHFQHHFAPPT